MGFSLAALFGFGRKKEAAAAAPMPQAPASASPAAQSPPGIPAVKPAVAGVTALIRTQGSALARDDLRAAYEGARALAEAYSAQGRLQLSSRWAIEAGALAVSIATRSAPGRPVVARAAAAAALKSLEAGRALAAGPYAAVLRRVCGLQATALMAGHGAWLEGLGFRTAPAVEEEAGQAAAEPVAA